MALTKVPSNLDAAVAITQSQSDNSTNVATTAYVDLAISNLSDSAPAALNTLNEIAAALGDDANYASTTTASIAGKLPLSGGAMTGPITTNSTFDGVDIATRDAILTSTTTTANAALPKAGGTMTGALTVNVTGSDVDAVTITGTGVADFDFVANPPEFNLEDTSSTSGTKRARITVNDNQLQIAGLPDDDTAVSQYLFYGNLNNGNVGIGTDSPGAKLEVADSDGGISVFINNTQSWSAANLSEFNNTALVINPRANGAQLRFSGSTGDVRIQSLTSDLSTAEDISLNPFGGNVGIGLTSPIDTKLVIKEVPATIVSGNAIHGSTMKGIKLISTLNGDESNGIWFGTNGSHWSGISGQRKNSGSTWGTNLSFYTHENATADLTYTRERMLIDSEGNVGIGTSSPSTRLDVEYAAAGTVSKFFDTGSNGGAQYNGAAVVGISRVGNGSVSLAGPLFQVGNDTSSSTSYNIDEPILTVTNTAVGVGTDTPATALDVVGDITQNSVTVKQEYFTLPASSTSGRRIRITLANYESCYVRIGAQRSNGGDAICYWEGIINNNNNANYATVFQSKSGNPSITFDYTTNYIFQWTFNAAMSPGWGTLYVQEIGGTATVQQLMT